MINVLVVDDSPTARALLVQILRSDPEIAVVGEARDGQEAVQLTRLRHPDIVTMDVRMPGIDGFEATRQIMIEAPTPIVIVSASLNHREVQASMQALSAGALTVLAKPSGPGAPSFLEECNQFIATIKAMSEVKVVRRWPDRAATSPAPKVSLARGGTRARFVAIATSTGGPAALYRILSQLPGDFPAPIGVVQHMSLGFAEGFANWLNTGTPLKVKLATSGEPLTAGTVYIAPDDRHLGISSQGTALVSSSAPVGGFRPSATTLFEATARVFGNATTAVMLTGMGEDGVVGLRAVKRAGGRIIAQNEESCVVFGMPGATIAAGLADVVLPLDAIAPALLQTV